MAEKNSLWKNIRKKAEQNRRTGAKPKKPTAEMLRQERKIKAQKANGGPVGDDDLMLSNIYNKYPAFRNMGNVTLKADTGFTKENTGIGDIEFFDSKTKEITYPNGYKVVNPSNNGSGIIYNPNTNTEQNIMLDMLHGMPSDPVYNKIKSELGDAYLNSEFAEDFYNDSKYFKNKVGEEKWKEWYGNDKGFFDKSYLDGVIRNLMFEGTAEDFKKNNYWEDARKEYFKDKDIKTKYTQLENYLKTGQGYVLPEVEIFGDKIKANGGPTKSLVQPPVLLDDNIIYPTDNPYMPGVNKDILDSDYDSYMRWREGFINNQGMTPEEYYQTYPSRQEYDRQNFDPANFYKGVSLAQGGPTDGKDDPFKSTLNQGVTVAKPAQDWVSSWVQHPEFANRLNENFRDHASKLSKKIYGNKEAKQRAAESNLKSINKAIPGVISDIYDTKFLYNTNPENNSQLLDLYRASYNDPEYDKFFKKTMSKNPQGFTDEQGRIVITNAANDQYGPESVSVHELMHKTGLYDDETFDRTFKGKFLTPSQDRLDKDFNRGEMYPFLMQMRFDNNFQPGEIITPERLKQIKESGYKNHLFKYYTDDEISKYLNTLASNQTQTPMQYAAQGGYMYDSGGNTNPVTLYKKAQYDPNTGKILEYAGTQGNEYYVTPNTPQGIDFERRLSEIEVVEDTGLYNPDIVGPTAPKFIPSETGWIQNPNWRGGDALEYVPIESALLPASLPIKASTNLGKVGKFAAEALNPLGGFRNISKKLVKSPNTFKSEIDWGKWNPDTPNYPELINEYNAIEESTKKAGTWMKNPDGSPFQGTPEQFIQQRSSWFKKYVEDAGGNYDEVINDPYFYHGSKTKGIKEFHTPQHADYTKATGDTPETGIFITKRKSLADIYASEKLFDDLTPKIGKKTGETYQLYAPANYANPGLKNPNNSNKLINTGTLKLKDVDYLESLGYSGLKQSSMFEGSERAIFNPNLLKSAVGNVGFFDITNPNIYKVVVPPAAIIGTGVVGAEAMQGSQPEQQSKGGHINPYMYYAGGPMQSTNNKYSKNNIMKYKRGGGVGGFFKDYGNYLINANLAPFEALTGKDFFDPEYNNKIFQVGDKITETASNIGMGMLGSMYLTPQGYQAARQGINSISDEFIDTPQQQQQQYPQQQYSPNVNQGLSFAATGGNINNNSLNLQNSMRGKYNSYKRKYSRGGTFQKYGINEIPESAGYHHQNAYGGVPIGPNAMAEGGEFVLDNNYVVSDQVDGMNTQTDEFGRTMAQNLKRDLSKYTLRDLDSKNRDQERRPYSDISSLTIEQIKQNAIIETEKARAEAQAKEEQRQAMVNGALQYAAAGGKLNKDLEKILSNDIQRYVEADNYYAYGGYLPKDKGFNMPNSYAKGGSIHIKKSKRGTFTAAAKKRGKSVQEFARQVLANKEKYSAAMVKKANFARNASKWKHADGGYTFGNETPEIIYPQQPMLYNIAPTDVEQPYVINNNQLLNSMPKRNPVISDEGFIYDDSETNVKPTTSLDYNIDKNIIDPNNKNLNANINFLRESSKGKIGVTGSYENSTTLTPQELEEIRTQQAINQQKLNLGLTGSRTFNTKNDGKIIVGGSVNSTMQPGSAPVYNYQGTVGYSTPKGNTFDANISRDAATGATTGKVSGKIVFGKAKGGPMVSNVAQPFQVAAQNRGGMMMNYAMGGNMYAMGGPGDELDPEQLKAQGFVEYEEYFYNPTTGQYIDKVSIDTRREKQLQERIDRFMEQDVKFDNSAIKPMASLLSNTGIENSPINTGIMTYDATPQATNPLGGIKKPGMENMIGSNTFEPGTTYSIANTNPYGSYYDLRYSDPNSFDFSLDRFPILDREGNIQTTPEDFARLQSVAGTDIEQSRLNRFTEPYNQVMSTRDKVRRAYQNKSPYLDNMVDEPAKSNKSNNYFRNLNTPNVIDAQGNTSSILSRRNKNQSTPVEPIERMQSRNLQQLPTDNTPLSITNNYPESSYRPATLTEEEQNMLDRMSNTAGFIPSDVMSGKLGTSTAPFPYEEGPVNISIPREANPGENIRFILPEGSDIIEDLPGTVSTQTKVSDAAIGLDNNLSDLPLNFTEKSAKKYGLNPNVNNINIVPKQPNDGLGIPDYISMVAQAAGPLIQSYYGLKGGDDVNYERIKADKIDPYKAIQIIRDYFTTGDNTTSYNLRQNAPTSGSFMSNMRSKLQNLKDKAAQIANMQYQADVANTQTQNQVNAQNAQIAMQEQIDRLQEKDAARTNVTEGFSGLGSSAANMIRDYRINQLNKTIAENIGTSNTQLVRGADGKYRLVMKPNSGNDWTPTPYNDPYKQNAPAANTGANAPSANVTPAAAPAANTTPKSVNFDDNIKDKTAGDAFRKWVNEKHPDYAKEKDLWVSGEYNNSYIKKAWDEYGKEYLGQ
jgi:hypothetical protein